MKNTFILFILMPFITFSQSKNDELNTFLNLEKIKPASVSLIVKNLSTNTNLLAYNEEKYMSPASLQKLLTTSAAISILGADFTFKTTIELKGNQVGTRFIGVLNIVAGGDPSLNQNFINEVYLFLKEQNIEILEGFIQVDEQKYANTPPKTWLLEDVANYYGTPAFGFNFLQNTYKLTFAKTSEGNKPEIVSSNPYMRHLKFDNQVLSAGTKDNAYIIGVPFSKERKIVGTIPSGKGVFTIKGAIDEPAQIFKNMLIRKFQEEQFGFAFNAQVEANETLFSKEIKSSSLANIIAETNINSNNLYAEALLNAMAIKKYGFASEQNAIKVLQTHFKDTDLQVFDGSGLSRKNRYSAAFLMSVLENNQSNTIFKSSLGISGVSGTMKYLFSEQTKAKFIGKSGSAEGILNYAAYFTNSKNENCAFVFTINNYKGSRAGIRNEMLKVLSKFL